MQNDLIEQYEVFNKVSLPFISNLRIWVGFDWVKD
jgi:hypothetical protein